MEENVKIQKIECDILSNFQTMCKSYKIVFILSYLFWKTKITTDFAQLILSYFAINNTVLQGGAF